MVARIVGMAVVGADVKIIRQGGDGLSQSSEVDK